MPVTAGVSVSVSVAVAVTVAVAVAVALEGSEVTFAGRSLFGSGVILLLFCIDSEGSGMLTFVGGREKGEG